MLVKTLNRQSRSESNIPRQEVKLNALRWQPTRSSERGHVFPSALIFAPTVIQVNLDEPIVHETSAEGWSDDRGALDLPVPMRRPQSAGNLGQKIINVTRATPRSRCGRICQWRVDTVNMPPQATQAAWNNRPIILCGLVAVMAKDRVVISIPLLEEIRSLVFLILLFPTFTPLMLA